MIIIDKRNGYDAIISQTVDGLQQGKVYVNITTGLVSNLYIRKRYRGDLSVLKAIIGTLISKYKFGYASPKQGIERRPALIRLYRRIGFYNKSTNKVVYDFNH